jgi:hypothetical protein
VVQRDQIINLLDDEHFINLSILGEENQEQKKERLIDIIKEKNIDVVHFEEISEAFESFNRVSKSLLNSIYTNDRTWKIVETCHNNWFSPNNRKLHPDAYSLVTPFHLEKTFKPGMTRENHAAVWHVDHILPCSSFDLSDPNQQRQCFHYTNLQALFVHENLTKSDKIL